MQAKVCKLRLSWLGWKCIKKFTPWAISTHAHVSYIIINLILILKNSFGYTEFQYRLYKQHGNQFMIDEFHKETLAGVSLTIPKRYHKIWRFKERPGTNFRQRPFVRNVESYCLVSGVSGTFAVCWYCYAMHHLHTCHVSKIFNVHFSFACKQFFMKDIGYPFCV